LISWVPNINLQYTSTTSLYEIPPREVLSSQRELLKESRGNAEGHVVSGGTVLAEIYHASTYHIPLELTREWPEIVAIYTKLIRGEGLDEHERLWVKELAEASGWSINDMVEELKNLDIDPSERVDVYGTLFEKYCREALERRKIGDTCQAGEKIWGAVTALVKLYATLKGVYIAFWSLKKLYSFVEKNVEEKHRKLFRDLLDKAFVLHTHFYEAHLDPEAFEERWKEVVSLIEKVKETLSQGQLRMQV